MKSDRRVLLEVIGLILAMVALYAGISAGVGLGQHLAEEGHPLLHSDP
jgi:hypothetical protein